MHNRDLLSRQWCPPEFDEKSSRTNVPTMNRPKVVTPKTSRDVTISTKQTDSVT